MPRVLLIDPDRTSRVALEQALAQAGITEVSGVSSGSFALTMLERERPDVVVCRARVADIDGHELCEIARSDPALSGVRFLLLAAPEDEAPAGAFQAADRVLVGTVDPETVVAEVQDLLAALAAARPPASSDPETDDGRGLRGSLAVMDLAEVAQAIGLGGKTGELIVTLGADEGTLVFERGRIVHAEFKRLRGEPAFAALLVAAHRGRGAFRFQPLERAAPSGGRTIDRSLESLLLSVAAEIDEGRAGTPAPRPAP
jgi:CheY-like chemotaxis protein